MAAQQGFKYESNVAKFLIKKGLVDKNYKPAGSGSARADLEMLWNKEKINVELKIEAASGGSLALQWAKGEWGFSAKVKDDPEKKFLADLAESSGALKVLNTKWKEIPVKFANKASQNITERRLASTMADAKTRKAKDIIYRKELVRFEEQNAALRGDVIGKYYAQKDTFYINIGTNGFYRLSDADPAGIHANCLRNRSAPLPVFSKIAKIKWRARVQAKGSGAFQYTFELSFTVPASGASPYNIGPCSGGGNVSIVARDADISCFS